jgi:signal transduction histidine kinase
MKTLVLRIYLSLVAVLLLFALLAGWLVKQHFDDEREQARRATAERVSGWAAVAADLLPPDRAPPEEQARALQELSSRLQVPMALDDAQGRRIATAAAFAAREAPWLARRLAEGLPPREGERAIERSRFRLTLPDGRSLLVWRGPLRPRFDAAPPQPAGPGADLGAGAGGRPHEPWLGPRGGWPFWPALGPAGGLVLLLALLFVAVAAAAWPVARRLTRRLETLQRGVVAFGEGQLQQRVAVEGRDEISSLALSFNRAAERVEALVVANRSLVANASHEIRSPLARLKLAVSMLQDLSPPSGGDRLSRSAGDALRDKLNREVHANIAELDALVDELLLASRLDASASTGTSRERLDLWALLDGEAQRARDEAAGLHGDPVAQARDPRTSSAASRDPSPDLSPAAASGAAGVWLDGPAPWPADRPRPLVLGDDRLLRRAIRNLLQNARRYGGARASVSIEADGATSPAWRIRVADQGPGVPAELRERIFEPFYRLPGHAEQQGGVGLGLSLVRQIAERHGGTARCLAGSGIAGSASPAGGAVFELRLPAAD